MWQPATFYPDPAVRILDPSFAKYRVMLAAVERIATGLRWAEGPVWFGDGRYLLCSDIPNNRIVKWEESTGAVSDFRRPSNNANGNTRDRQGRLVTCEHDTRRVTRTEYDGTITVILDRFEGKKLNSPNDIVVKSDGSIWFTDPPFGILSNYEGHVDEQELGTNVYRVDGETGKATVVAAEINWVYDVVAEGTKLAKGKVHIHAGDGTPDGFRCDVDGNLWAGWGMGNSELDGVRIFNPAGEPIGHVTLPERAANLCFGGVKRNRLFMAGSQSIYALYVNTQGAIGG